MLVGVNGFSPEDYQKKVVPDYKELKEKANACRTLGGRVVVTIGTWDMLHIGHVRYMMRARSAGDVLIVGVDSDAAVKKYKGPQRPIIPQDERAEMVTYLGCVDFVTFVDDVTPKGRWQYGLIRVVRPDVFVAVEESYLESQQRMIAKYCAKLEVLPRQAERTSSSNVVQNILKGQLLPLLGMMEQR